MGLEEISLGIKAACHQNGRTGSMPLTCLCLDNTMVHGLSHSAEHLGLFLYNPCLCKGLSPSQMILVILGSKL